jgi:hypothetical protein
MPIAPGDVFLVDASELDLPGVAAAFDVMVLEKLIRIEQTGIEPLLH